MTLQELNVLKMNCGNAYERHLDELDAQEELKNISYAPSADTI